MPDAGNAYLETHNQPIRRAKKKEIMHWHFEREHLCTEMLRCSDGEYENFCYILWEREDRTAVLIDPAWEPAKFEDLIDQLQLQVKSVLLTHSHPDHLHLADYMATRYQVPAWISATEYEYYQPILDHVNLWQSSDKLQWDRLAIEVIPTPGHTQGGLCFVAGDFAFTGEIDFTDTITLQYDQNFISFFFTTLDYWNKQKSSNTKPFIN